MNVIFKYKELLKLPKLAWISVIKKGNHNVDIYHGNAVETKKSWFSAGVWDGSFTEGDFINCQFACNSAGTIDDNMIKFCTPSHLLESLNVMCVDECLFVSNSLPLLLAFTDSELDVNYPIYEEKLCSSLYGLNHRVEEIPLAYNRKLIQYRYSILSVNIETLDIVDAKRMQSLDFETFEDYRETVVNILRKIVNNAQDKSRKTPYGMISRISRGYDAVGVSALVRELGCEEVMTFNSPGSYSNDDGTEIAKTLGFTKIYSENGDKFKLNSDFLEAESCASGDVGTAVQFAAYPELFSDKIKFGGERGDSIWTRNHMNVNNNLDFSFGSGLTQAYISYIEHNLRENSVEIMPVLIGAEKWTKISQISKSSDMMPWSIGGYYDRPIPRRIAEEKGVLREKFGQKKMGAGISYHFDTLSYMRFKMSKASYDSFVQFRKSIKRNKWKKMIYSIEYYINEAPLYFSYLFSKLGVPLNIDCSKSGYKSSPLSSDLIFWGCHVMKQRYKKAFISK